MTGILNKQSRWHDWEEWAVSCKPSLHLEILKNSQELKFFPELFSMVDVLQDPKWHPEGDVWQHTLHVCDQAAIIGRRDNLSNNELIELLFAALCHDMGKPSTTIYEDNRWKAPGHPAAGIPIAESFLLKINASKELISIAKPLVGEHLVHAQLSMGNKAIRKVIKRLYPASFDQLFRLIEADLSGRPPLPTGLPQTVLDFKVRFNEIEKTIPFELIEATEPLIMGRHIIELGYKPQKWFKDVLAYCHEAQIQGKFNDELEALQFLKTHLKDKNFNQN